MYVLLLTIIFAIGGLAAIYFERPAVLLLALAAPVGVWAVVKRPALALGGCVVIGAYTMALSGGSVPLTPYKLATFAVAGIAVMQLAKGKPPRLPESWLTVPVVVLTLVVCTSELFSEVTDTRALLDLIAVGIMGYGAMQLLTSLDAMRSMAIALAFGQLWMAATVWRQVGWAALNTGGVLRAGGLAHQPNSSAAIAVFWFFVGLPLAFDRKSPLAVRLLGLATVPAFTYVIFATASRGAAVASVVALAAWGVSQASSFRAAVVSTLFVATLGFGGLELAPESFTARMLGTVQFDEHTGEAVSAQDSGRRELARSSLVLIAKRPLLGGGIRGSATARARRGELATTTHSTYLAIADSYGVPALLLVLFVMFRAGLAGFQSYRSSSGPRRLYVSGLMASYIGLLVFSVGAADVIDQNLWLLMAMIAAVNRVEAAPAVESAAAAPSPAEVVTA